MSKDLAINLLINAVDHASKDIKQVNDKVKQLRSELDRTEFSRAGDGLVALGRSAKEAAQPMADAATHALALGAAITALSTALAGKVYDAAVQYEAALMDLAKVLAGGREQAEAYGDALDQLALRYAQNGQDLLAAMANFVQAGYDAQEAFDLVEQSVQAMIAGDLEAGTAASRLVSILKGFNAPASEAARVVDILNETSNNYAATVDQLSEGMAALSPIASQAGFSFEETAGLLTPIIEVFQSGAEAADGLKTGLLKLSDDSAPVAAALAELGVAQRTASGELRSGRDIFFDVARAMAGLDDAQRQYLTAQIVGIDQAARMSVVFADVGKVLAVTETATQSAGSALREVDVRLQTAEAQIKRTDEQFRQLARTLGEQFKAEITGVVAATGAMAQALNDATRSGSLDPLFQALRPQVEAIENLLNAMAGNLEEALQGVDWTPLVEGIAALGEEFGVVFGELTDGLDLTTVEGLRDLLQGMINILGKFSQYLAGVIDGLTPFAASLNLLGQWFAREGVPQLSKFIGELNGLALSLNTLIPFLAEFTARVFGVVGATIKFVAQIALLAAGLKLLHAAGVPVLGLLSGLVTRFLALSPAAAGVVSALAGLPGAVAALVAASGAAGYALGALINKGWEFVLGGRTLGTALYDLVHWNDELNNSLTRAATAEELAAARARRLAREQRERAAALRESTAQTNAQAAADRLLMDRAEQSRAITDALTAAFAAQGREYDARTGRVRAATAAEHSLDQAMAQQDATARAGVTVLEYRNGLLYAVTDASRSAAAETQRLADVVAQAAREDAESYAAKLGSIRAQQQELLNLADAEATRRLSYARAMGQETAQIERELADAKRSALQGIEREYQAHIDRLIAQERQRLRAVEQIEQQIAALKQSAEDRIRSILQSGMTDYERYQDQQRQIAEKGTQAREALMAGEFERAATLYQEQAELAARSAREVRDGDAVAVTAKEAAARAAQQYQQAIENATRALESQKSAEMQRAEAARQAAEDAQSALSGVQAQLQTLDQANTSSEHRVESNVDAVRNDIDSLDGRNTSSTHTIYERKVQQYASGGLVAQRYASGGAVFPRLSGTVVPGSGNADTHRAALPAGSYVLRKAASLQFRDVIDALVGRYASGGLVPTLLTPGERVIPPNIVSRVGVGLLDRLNALDLGAVRRFSEGGAVAPLAAAAPVRDSVDINLSLGSRRASFQGSRDQAVALTEMLSDLRRGL